MSRHDRRFLSVLRILPMGLLLSLASAPLLALFGSCSNCTRIDWGSVAGTLAFSLTGAALATAVGAVGGIVVGTREFTGRRWVIGPSVGLIAAPPAFWWIGATRFGPTASLVTGPSGAALVAGLALSPITLLLVLAALRELPSNLYEAARVALPPTARLRVVLVPLLRPALGGGFLLSAILLLGESELPFLFGFRTVMTDIVTTFSQTFDVASTTRLIIPLLALVAVLGVLAGRPLVGAALTSPRGAHGVVRTRASASLALCAAAPPTLLLLSIAGYGWATVAAIPNWWPRIPITGFTVLVSIAEPVVCAWATVLVTLVALYPARESRAMRYFLWASLLLFCVPSAVYAIGWIRLSALEGVTIPPIVAHASRTFGLPALGFAVAYSRMPKSLEDAAKLVAVSPVRRAFVLILPVLLPSLAASSVLVAALVYADRDVASLLLPPGASRLMLELYLLSANAASSTVGAVALTALGGAAFALGLGALGPLWLWGRRG